MIFYVVDDDDDDDDVDDDDDDDGDDDDYSYYLTGCWFCIWFYCGAVFTDNSLCVHWSCNFIFGKQIVHHFVIFSLLVTTHCLSYLV